MPSLRKVVREAWEGLWYQDYEGNFPLGGRLVVIGIVGGLMVGLSAVMSTCQDTSYARRDQMIQQMYRQADKNNNGVLEEDEATGLFKVLMENKYPLPIGELEKKGFPGLDQQDFERYLEQQK